MKTPKKSTMKSLPKPVAPTGKKATWGADHRAKQEKK
jgi:hypothetical protein